MVYEHVSRGALLVRYTTYCAKASCVFFFFFQAEDGIRDADVTGVQTCALPIYLLNILLQLLEHGRRRLPGRHHADRKSTRLNSSHVRISYAVFCLKKKKNMHVPLSTKADHNGLVYLQIPRNKAYLIRHVPERTS